MCIQPISPRRLGISRRSLGALLCGDLEDKLAFTQKHHRQSGADLEATLAALGLGHAIDRHPRDLSGGER